MSKTPEDLLDKTFTVFRHFPPTLGVHVRHQHTAILEADLLFTVAAPFSHWNGNLFRNGADRPPTFSEPSHVPLSRVKYLIGLRWLYP